MKEINNFNIVFFEGDLQALCENGYTNYGDIQYTVLPGTQRMGFYLNMIPKEQKEKIETCKWKDKDCYGNFETECNEVFYYEGELKDNSYTFCPNCGKKIKETKGET